MLFAQTIFQLSVLENARTKVLSDPTSLFFLNNPVAFIVIVDLISEGDHHYLSKEWEIVPGHHYQQEIA